MYRDILKQPLTPVFRGGVKHCIWVGNIADGIANSYFWHRNRPFPTSPANHLTVASLVELHTTVCEARPESDVPQFQITSFNCCVSWLTDRSSTQTLYISWFYLTLVAKSADAKREKGNSNSMFVLLYTKTLCISWLHNFSFSVCWCTEGRVTATGCTPRLYTQTLCINWLRNSSAAKQVNVRLRGCCFC